MYSIWRGRMNRPAIQKMTKMMCPAFSQKYSVARISCMTVI